MAGYTFISYTHENSRFTQRLARRLQKRGISIWLDQWHLSQDESWDRSIAHALKGCRHVLLILSPDALNSWVVQDQVMLALREGKQIIPVLHQPCNLPLPLQELSYVDFTRRNHKNALSQLFSHYFPDSELKADPWPIPKLDWRQETRTWLSKLLPLLWPGWLGPALVIALLLIAALYYWTPGRPKRFSASPAPETLAVIRPTATPPPQVDPIEARLRRQDGQIMVAVPAGDFLMGSLASDPLASADEKPQRPVYLDHFWIDKTEISNAQYQLCVEAGVCTPPHAQPTIFREAPLPVVGVDWEQAATYCRWVGGRLPTEAEWEKAARGLDGRLYPWGNEFDRERLNYCDVNCAADWRDFGGDDGYSYTAPVGSFPAGASPYGALDMSGNVWEWVVDWYDPQAYTHAPDKNPTGPASGLQRVIRGGSWYYQGRNLRVVNRHKDVPTSSYDNIGFRCVAPGEPG
jgi:formylglycine-generating enzyme required for sulfatase activity